MRRGDLEAWSIQPQAGFGVSVTIMDVRWIASGRSRPNGLVQQCFAGWPCTAIFGETAYDLGPGAVKANVRFEGALGIGTNAGAAARSRPTLLPLRPIWPGFATNTLFYAAILWLLFAAPFALRHHIRIKRGLCSACAYPIGTSHLCTECGALVKKFNAA
jgi:hypothetical protein